MVQVAEVSESPKSTAALAGVCHYAQYKRSTGIPGGQGADRTKWDSSFLATISDTSSSTQAIGLSRAVEDGVRQCVTSRNVSAVRVSQGADRTKWNSFSLATTTSGSSSSPTRAINSYRLSRAVTVESSS
jgi:hypothetical protein